jgi:predicted aspartyl protease
MNNNPRPTCKAVKRPNQRGARIHPRGCRVRYILHNDGTIRKHAKADNRLKPAKQNIELQGDRHFMFRAKVGDSPSTRFLWDTGATTTAMSQKTARKLRLLGTNNQPINGYKWGRDYSATIASGESIRIKSIDNVPLTFADYSQETVTGMVTITMDETSSSLFGVNMIRKVKTLKIKNK